MSTLTVESVESVTKLIDEALASARYLVDAKGDKTDVVLSLAVWQQLLVWLETVDDHMVVREWLPHLQAGPDASGALRWNDVAAEWEDESSL